MSKKKKKKKVNKQYRDRLFKLIFGEEERKQYTLDLYNALNNSSYTNVDDLKLVTLEDAFYVGMKNDVSFIFSDVLSLYEQQSTINPNMPLRMALYIFEEINRYIEDNKLDLYSSSIQMIPAPKCVVFYNGRAPFPEKKKYYLSNSYINHEKGDVEVMVMVYNINGRNNIELKKKCPVLFEYSWLIDETERNRKKGMDLDASVDTMIDSVPDNFQLKEFLVKERDKIMNVLFKKYTVDDYKETGYKDGVNDNKRENAKNLLSLNMDDEFIKKAINVNQDTIDQLKKELKI